MSRAVKSRVANRILNRVIAYSLLMVAMVGGFGVVTVWMRHQATQSANRLQTIEQSILEERRELARLDVEHAIAVSTDKLIERSLELGLREPAYTQIVHVTEDVEDRLYEKRANSVFTAAISNRN